MILSRTLEPLLVLRSLLPAVVGLAWTNEFDRGAEVLPVRPGAIAGAGRTQTIVVRCESCGIRICPAAKVAPLETNRPLDGTCIDQVPEVVPVVQVLGTSERQEPPA